MLTRSAVAAAASMSSPIDAVTGSASPGVASVPQAPPTPITHIEPPIEPRLNFSAHPKDLSVEKRRDELEGINRVWPLRYPRDSGEKEFKVSVIDPRRERQERREHERRQRQERRERERRERERWERERRDRQARLQARFQREMESSLDGRYWEIPVGSRREIRRLDVVP